jgi:hypothetical protein
MTPCVSGYTISSTKVNPPGYQAAGTPMTVMFVVDFPWRGNETFPQGSELQGSTDLDEAYWVPVLVLDGEDIRMTVQSGKSLVISGWYLSYPSYQDVHLMVTLTGKIPATPSSKQDLFRIQETDSAKNIVSTAHVEMPEAPIMTPSTALPAPTKKSTTQKIFTPIPTATSTPQSPIGIEAGIIAIMGAALLGMRRI